MTSKDDPDLERAIQSLDEEVAAALAELVESDPEFVRSMLREYGYLVDAEEDRQQEQERIAGLSKSERRLLDICVDLGNPKSIVQIAELIEQEHPEFLADYSSASDRSWLNRKLNTLVDEGLIGKYREGRTVYYTGEIEDAVRHWALHNSRFVEALSTDDIDDIVADTGMPRQKVVTALNSLSE
jgi:hypothetical protein